MPLENHSGKNKLNPGKPGPIKKGAIVTAPVPEIEETILAEMPVAASLKPVEAPPPQVVPSYYAEASLTKKLTVFSVTTVLILIALGFIYAFWPLGIVR